MSIEATFDPANLTGASAPEGRFHQLGPDLAVFMVADEDPIDPIDSPEILPAGWSTTGETIPINIRTEQDHWVYILERAHE